MADRCEIRIYDENFVWQGVVKTAESVILNRKHREIDTFEVRIQPDKLNADAFLKKKNFVVFNGNYEKAGIIRDFSIEENREESVLVVRGEGIDGVLKQRVTIPPTKAEDPTAFGYDFVRGSAETVLKHYISRNLTSPKDSKRKIPYIKLEEDKKRGLVFPWYSRYDTLNDVVKSVCEYGDVGYKYVFDNENKQVIFYFNEGVDRTTKQKAVSPVTFRMSNHNIGSYRYTEDYSNYKTTGICGGAGEDENRLIYTLGTNYEGIDRHEIFLDCGNVEIDELMYYGRQKLKDYTEVISLEADALPRNFIFEKDFFLGDKVTCIIDRLDLELDLRVTSVTESWERDTGYTYEIKFGDDIPNLISDINLKTQKEVR